MDNPEKLATNLCRLFPPPHSLYIRVSTPMEIKYGSCGDEKLQQIFLDGLNIGKYHSLILLLVIALH
jgi:hypothetical protein